MLRVRLSLLVCGFLPLFFGCVKKGNLSESGNRSPFSESKLVITPQSKSQTLNLDVIVNKQCLFNRAQKRIRGFIEDYLPANAPISENDLLGFPEFAFSAVFPKSNAKGSVSAQIESDSCVVGASTTKTNVLKPSYNDTRYADQDYLKSIRFDEADLIFKREISSGSKVKVAFIDSGIDLNNEDLGSVTASLDGLNLLDKSTMVQDQLGHGTSVSSIVTAVRNNQKGLVGIASDNTVMIPVKLFSSENQNMNSWMVFDAIARSVNAGAEVINMSFVSYDNAYCDPVVGHAIYRAIEKGVSFVFSAGAGIKVLSDGTVVRGEVYSPSDNQASEGPTVAPACWGRYFKGALTVGGLDSHLTRIDPLSSNWGPAIEIAAPSQSVAVYSLQNQISRKSGTSLSAPMVTGAMALVAAFFKENKWEGSPWLYEDVLLQGSEVVLGLNAEFSGGRVLNLKKLAEYLVSLKNTRKEDRLHLPSENPEVGRGLNPGLETGRVIRLEVYTKTPNIRNNERAQFNAVAYYENNSFKVITNQAQWRSSSTDISVDAQGIVSVGVGKLGNYRLSASFQGVEGSAELFVIPFNPVTGNSGALESIDIIEPQGEVICCITDASINFKAQGNYGSQGKRDISSSASWSSATPSEIKTGPGAAGYIVNIENAVPNKTYIVTAAYEGKIGRKEIVFPTIGFVSLDLGLPNKSVFTQGEKFDVGTQLTVMYPSRRQEERLIVPEWKSNNQSVLKVLNGGDGGKYWRQIDTRSLPVGKYQISARYFFRADGNPRFVETSAWEFTVKESPLQSLEFKIQQPFSVVPGDAILLGTYGVFLRVHGVLANGAKVIIPLSEIDFKILDANEQTSPLMWTKPFTDMFSTHIFGRAVGERIWLRAIHKATGIELAKSFVTHGKLEHVGNSNVGLVNIPATVPVPQTDNFCLDKEERIPFAGGAGTASDPFLICSLAQLERASASSLKSTGMNPNILYFQLRTNLDLSPLGNLAINPLNLGGYWDGSGFEFQNPTAIDAEKLYLGVLCTGQCGIKKVKNLGIRNPNVRGRAYVGAFIGGSAAESFENVYVTEGQVIGESDVGGILGNTGFTEILIRVRNIGTKVFSERGAAGGIVGNFSGRLIQGALVRTDLSYIGVPTASTRLTIGGIAGLLSGDGAKCSSVDLESASMGSGTYCRGMIRDSGYVGSIRAGGSSGGIAGENLFGVILRSWANVQIMSLFGSVGGVVGFNKGDSGYTFSGLLFASYATGQIWGSSASTSKTGGLVGATKFAIIQQSSAQVEVRGNDFLGGIAGESACFNQFRGDQSNSTLIKTGGDSVGGFLGAKTCGADYPIIDDLLAANKWSRNQSSGLSSVGMLMKRANVDLPGITKE